VTLTALPLTAIRSWQAGVMILFLLDIAVFCVVVVRLPRSAAVTCLLILVFLETGVHGMVYNTVTRSRDFYPSSSVTDFLRQKFTEHPYGTLPWGNVFPANLGTWYGFNQFTTYDALGLETAEPLRRAVGMHNQTDEFVLWNEPSLSTLAFLNVKYLLFAREDGELFLRNHPGLRTAFADNAVLVLEQPALPRAYFIPAATEAAAADRLQQLVAAPDPATVQAPSAYRLEQDGTVEATFPPGVTGYTVFVQNAYPGWEATVDGQRISLHDMFGLPVLALPAGEHTVRLAYRPRSVRVGVWLSAAGLAAWCAGWYCLRKLKTA
jgi:hypothetical protein